MSRPSKKEKQVTNEAERTYTPAEVCELFDVARTTLFRWEEQEEIPKAIRREGERIYTQEHLQTIQSLMRKRLREEINAASRYDPDEEHPTVDQLERLCRLEFVSPGEQKHGLQTLLALSKRHRLSKKTLDLLIKLASRRPIGDPLREMIWELLSTQDRLVKESGG
ncbi:MAG: MerR family transcriptional regulator [Blastocatellia bacterium]|nr:MerR family transcriptional regulator [Blastocatellia bacterium]